LGLSWRLEPLHAPFALVVVACAGDSERHLIEVPFIPKPRMSVPEQIGALLTKLSTPFPDGFLGNHSPTGEQQFLNIPVAQTIAEVQPHAVADDLRWVPIFLVGIGRVDMFTPRLCHTATVFDKLTMPALERGGSISLHPD
jgi:hypothetical protein